MFKVVAILTSISMLTDFESVSKFTDQKTNEEKTEIPLFLLLPMRY